MAPVTRDQIEEVVAQLTPQPTHIQWVPHDRAAASTTTWHGDHIIRFGEDLLGEPQRAFFLVAHECGHIALGHKRPHRTAVTLLLCLGSLIVAVAAAIQMAVSINPGAAGLTLFVTFGVLMHLVFRFRYRRWELKADTFAHAHGYSMIGLAPDTDRSWQHKMLSMHPPWDQRQEHARQQDRKRP